jgi:hypothetical protein
MHSWLTKDYSGIDIENIRQQLLKHKVCIEACAGRKCIELALNGSYFDITAEIPIWGNETIHRIWNCHTVDSTAIVLVHPMQFVIALPYPWIPTTHICAYCGSAEHNDCSDTHGDDI